MFPTVDFNRSAPCFVRQGPFLVNGKSYAIGDKVEGLNEERLRVLVHHGMLTQDPNDTHIRAYQARMAAAAADKKKAGPSSKPAG